MKNNDYGAVKDKHFPEKYRTSVLKALSVYPELEHTEIYFKLTDKHPVPYGTTLALTSIFKSAEKRTYYITLLEKAKGPEEAALFKNLNEDKRVAVIAHELVHVLQFKAC